MELLATIDKLLPFLLPLPLLLLLLLLHHQMCLFGAIIQCFMKYYYHHDADVAIAIAVADDNVDSETSNAGSIGNEIAFESHN